MCVRRRWLVSPILDLARKPQSASGHSFVSLSSGLLRVEGGNFAIWIRAFSMCPGISLIWRFTAATLLKSREQYGHCTGALGSLGDAAGANSSCFRASSCVYAWMVFKWATLEVRFLWMLPHSGQATGSEVRAFVGTCACLANNVDGALFSEHHLQSFGIEGCISRWRSP